MRESARGRRARRATTLALVAVAAPTLAGCAGSQDALAPKSHQAQDIATLFWWMTGGAFVGLGLIVALLLWSVRRRDAGGLGGDGHDLVAPAERRAWYVVVGGGIVLPIVVVGGLFVVSDVFVIRTTQAPAAASTRLTIDVIGHQWWWEVRYPGHAAPSPRTRSTSRCARPCGVEVRTADVIHSFWVPQLNRKIDTIPGQRNAWRSTPTPSVATAASAPSSAGCSTRTWRSRSWPTRPTSSGAGSPRRPRLPHARDDRGAAGRAGVREHLRELPRDPRHRGER